MAGTLRVRIGRPDAKVMSHYRYMWLVERDGLAVGWGHANRRDEAEAEAWDLIVSAIRPDEVDNLRQIQR